jgi:hypothetical protein
MQDRVDRPVHEDVLTDVVADEAEAAFGFEVRDVARVARQQVVHRDHIVPFAEQAIAEVAAEEACAAGHENSHGRLASDVGQGRPTLA